MPAVVAALALQELAPQPAAGGRARDLTRHRGASVTAVKPNYDEAIALLGRAPRTPGACAPSRWRRRTACFTSPEPAWRR
ncbi:MAG: hypothetical protein U0531_09170 [Dehalococcoidia bacterium]